MSSHRPPEEGASNRLRWIPSAISGLRIALLPVIGFAWMQGKSTATLLLYGLVVLSDWLDGRLARRWRVASRWGAYMDAVADMVVTIGLLGVLAFNGALPTWVPGVPCVVAVMFFATSPRGNLRYDWLGKYYGAYLYVMVGVLLFGASAFVSQGLTLVLFVLSMAVLANRLASGRGTSA